MELTYVCGTFVTYGTELASYPKNPRFLPQRSHKYVRQSPRFTAAVIVVLVACCLLTFTSVVLIDSGQNILYGCPSDSTAITALDEVIAASKDANAHAFIEQLPQKYDSVVGTSVSSTQLSGGQRQRICIARAILRNPTFLLLDEATSALDTTSELVVQAALDRLVEPSSGRALKTSLTIAHRLSTVKSSDRIVVLSRGRVIEDGSHRELMTIDNGVYRHLFSLQDMSDVPSESVVGGGAQPDLLPSANSASPIKPRPANSQNLTPAEPSVHSVSPDSISVSIPISGSDATAGSTASSAPDNALESSAAVGPVKDPSKDQELERLKDILEPVPSSRVWGLQRPEIGYLVLGLLGSLAGGGLQPIFAILWSDMINTFFSPDDALLRAQSTLYIAWFAIIAFGQVTFTIFRIGSFVLVGERLTYRLRNMAYRSLLRQEVSFFDEPLNSVGRLSTRLASDAAEVKGGTGEGLSLVFQAGASILTGIVIAFVANWQLALVVTAILPIMVFTALLEGQAWKGFTPGAAKAMEDAGHVALEATTAIRTVSAFNLQCRLVSSFDACLEYPVRAGIRQAFVSGASQGFSQFIMFSGYALAFFVGGHFITLGILTFAQLMRVFLALTMAAQGAGQVCKSCRVVVCIFRNVNPLFLYAGNNVGSQPKQGRTRNSFYLSPYRPCAAD